MSRHAERNPMSKKAAEHHRRASEHLKHAAHHHEEAAKHHDAGHHEKAAHHAHTARGHVIHGRGYAEEAVKVKSTARNNPGRDTMRSKRAAAQASRPHLG